MKNRLDQSNTLPGCTKPLTRNKNEHNPYPVLCRPCHPSIAMSPARRETPLPVPAVAQRGLWDRNPPTAPSTPGHLLRCICKAPKLNLQKPIKQQQVVKLQKKQPITPPHLAGKRSYLFHDFPGKICKAGRGGKRRESNFWQ